MQNTFRKVLPITAVLTLAFGILVMAAHSSTVSIYPTDSQLGNIIDFKIIVKNDGGDNINRFEITLPETYDQKPIYLEDFAVKTSVYHKRRLRPLSLAS